MISLQKIFKIFDHNCRILFEEHLLVGHFGISEGFFWKFCSLGTVLKKHKHSKVNCETKCKTVQFQFNLRTQILKATALRQNKNCLTYNEFTNRFQYFMFDLHYQKKTFLNSSFFIWKHNPFFKQSRVLSHSFVPNPFIVAQYIYVYICLLMLPLPCVSI